MSGSASTRPVHELAAELELAFDRGFAEPRRALDAEVHDFLVVAVGDERYALRVAALSGLVADRRIVALPSPLRELHGVVAVRGALVPVYSVRALLDYPPASTPTRWLVLTGKTPGVGLAFDRLEQHTRVDAARITVASQQGPRRHVRETISVDDALVPVLDLGSLHADIERRVRELRGVG